MGWSFWKFCQDGARRWIWTGWSGACEHFAGERGYFILHQQKSLCWGWNRELVRFGPLKILSGGAAWVLLKFCRGGVEDPLCERLGPYFTYLMRAEIILATRKWHRRHGIYQCFTFNPPKIQSSDKSKILHQFTLIFLSTIFVLVFSYKIEKKHQ